MRKPLRIAMMAVIATIWIYVAPAPITAFAESNAGGDTAPVADAKVDMKDKLSIISSAKPSAMVAPGETEIGLTFTNYGDARIENVRIIREDGTVADEILSLGKESASYIFTETVMLTAEQLDANGITYRISYDIYDENGEPLSREQAVMISVIKKKAEPKLEFTRTLSSDHVQKGDEVTITYRVRNTGNVPLTHISLVDDLIDESGVIDTLEVLEPGKKWNFNKKVKVNQTSVSRPSVSYTYEGNGDGVVESLKAATIYLANEQLDLILESDKNAISPGDMVTLRLNLANNGNVTYESLRISEPRLGELGVIPVKLKPGKEYTFSKTVNLKSTTTFQFDVSGKGGNGAEFEESSNMLTIEVSPAVGNIVVGLSASAEPARLAAPGPVNFLIEIENKSGLDIRNAMLSEQTRGALKNLAVLAPGVTPIEHTYDVSSTGTYVFLIELVDSEGGRLTVLSNPVTVEMDQTIDPSLSLFPEASATEVPRITGISYQLDHTSTFQRMMISVILLLIAMALVMAIVLLRKRKEIRRKRMLRQKRLKRLKREEKPPREEIEQTRRHAVVHKLPPEERESKRRAARMKKRRRDANGQ